MEWDLGFRGIFLRLAMSLGFGLVAQLVMWRAMTHRLWLIATAVYFASGIFVSEVWFGWATEEELQPNIDGLSFDEVMLLGTPISIVFVLAGWIVGKRLSGARQPST